MNIKFYKFKGFSFIATLRAVYFFLKNVFKQYTPSLLSIKWVLSCLGLISLGLSLVSYQGYVFSTPVIIEPVQACVIARNQCLDAELRAHIAQCLGWQEDPCCPLCLGFYRPLPITPIASSDELRILADRVSFYRNKRSSLSGHVEIQQSHRVVNAETAYIYRDPKTDKVIKIEFLGEVRYLEPDKLMIAKTAVINPQDNSGLTQDVLYRLNIDKHEAILPAWGRASLIQRFANKDLFMCKATYTTCAPQDKAWDIEADSIMLDSENARGVARNARLRILNRTVLYAPYLSFPTSDARKSGFLMPLFGYSNVSGLDVGLPYYWNIAPNYDFTFLPHWYTKRGLMLGGEYRFLTNNSFGTIIGNFLPKDRAFANFLNTFENEFPQLRGKSSNRWSLAVLDSTQITDNLEFNAEIHQVSDDYYLQDFSTNLAFITQRQFLRQAELTYTSEHWILRGMGQSYQTLHPINESFISNIYERLPQLMAEGFYYDLPFGVHFNVLGQYDQFHWPSDQWLPLPTQMPEGPRFHLNPIVSLPWVKPCAYITPSLQFVENYYQVQSNVYDPLYFINPPVFDPPFARFNTDNINAQHVNFNRIIPRFSIDSGLYFERDSQLFGDSFIQTLEPRLFYLNVPYQNQTVLPVYDSAYMIFNVDQLFRTNRFSGFDRIGDTNQLSYALTTRWLDAETGAERANLSLGQIKYFAQRKVTLCQSVTGFCIDNPYTFGYLSPYSSTSPIALRGNYFLSPAWGITADYVWDTATRATNNSDVNIHFQPNPDEIINFGYSYLVNADLSRLQLNNTENRALHQATLAFNWPFSPQWSSIGVFSHNISDNYSMMSLAGLQYNSCCWAMRLLGGRTFQSLNADYQPQYNNNIYLQILLKGLGSVATSDPASILNTYLPGYVDLFHK